MNTSAPETMQFKAETQQLLDLMIHSIYSNKEIFLRELISNSSDAIDKLRFLAIEDPSLINNDEEFAVNIDPDSKTRQIKISDNGIGMDKDEVISLIGTIARSGTKEILEKMKNDKTGNAELIGQFGVGFYSAFIVADKVTLLTRKAGDKMGVKWESTGDGTYTIEEIAKPSRGTEITLHLKPEDAENGMQDFTQTWVLESIIKKYSDFISYPVKLHKVSEETSEESENKTIVDEWKTINSQKPIWTRSKSDLKEEEYNEFYKHIARDYQDPLKTIPYRAEGRIEYLALLYLPSAIPFDYHFQNFKGGLQLYVKRVMISDSAEDLLPKYLRFVRGVVDSSDISLNISREMLQQDRQITFIRKGLTTKLLNIFREMLEKERDKYESFWSQFGTTIKEGLTSDFENKEKLMNLILFESSNEDSKLNTLAEYVGRMHPKQEEIFFISGESRELLSNSPHVEKVLSHGFEILYLVDPVDDFIMQHLTEYDGKKFKAIDKGEINLGDEKAKKESEEKVKKAGKDNEKLLERLKEILKDYVKDVKITDRLVQSPACLTGENFDMSAHIEKLLKKSGEASPTIKRVLELNPEHSLFTKMISRFEKDPKDGQLEKTAHLLLGFATLAEGGELPNPSIFNRELIGLLQDAI